MGYWNGIESSVIWDGDYIQMGFRNNLEDGVAVKCYWVSGKKRNEEFERYFDSPDSASNKRDAYNYYWEMEQALIERTDPKFRNMEQVQ